MREILFRGKRVDNGEWFYGVPTIDSRGQTVIVENVFDCDEYNCRGASCLYVDENTIGQYTGLTDKNGNKIFEGDIVRYQFDNNDCPFPNKRTEPILGRVFFSDFRASFSVTAGRNGGSALNNDLFKYVQNGNRVEVIGNINDNPELLKERDGE